MSGRWAAMDETFTIEPSASELWSPVIVSPNTWLGSTVPRRLRSNTSRNSSSGSPKKVASSLTVAAGTFPPAALTRTSTRPQRSSTASRAASSCSLFSTSAGRASASPPRFSTSAATSSARSLRRPSTPIRAPARAKPLAIAPPSTPVAPVTTATLPDRSNSRSGDGVQGSTINSLLPFCRSRGTRLPRHARFGLEREGYELSAGRGSVDPQYDLDRLAGLLARDGRLATFAQRREDLLQLPPVRGSEG